MHKTAAKRSTVRIVKVPNNVSQTGIGERNRGRDSRVENTLLIKAIKLYTQICNIHE